MYGTMFKLPFAYANIIPKNVGITEVKLFFKYPVQLPYCILPFDLQESNLSVTFMVQILTERS